MERLQRRRKGRLRAKFDRLKAEEAAAGNDSELERFLDRIGTGRRR